LRFWKTYFTAPPLVPKRPKITVTQSEASPIYLPDLQTLMASVTHDIDLKVLGDNLYSNLRDQLILCAKSEAAPFCAKPFSKICCDRIPVLSGTGTHRCSLLKALM
jgi:hypothetical protein